MQSLFGSDAGKLALKEEQENMLDMISLRFDEGEEYNVGDYCLYFNGVYDGLYQFRNQKAPSPWMESTVIPVKLSDILKQQTSSLSSLREEMTPDNLFAQIFNRPEHQIPRGADLNDYTSKVGSYWCKSNEDSLTLLNCPKTTSGFRLYVISTSSTYLLWGNQIIITHSIPSSIFIRSIQNGMIPEEKNQWEQVQMVSV